MSENPGKTTDFSNIQESLNQQQAQILKLRELVRQSESNQGRNLATDKEKVKSIAQRLTNLKTKATKGKLKYRSQSEVAEDHGGITNIQEERHAESMEVDHASVSVSSTPPPPITRARSETGSEKIILLRQQMEQNRLKMAERESKNRDIEQMVVQLKSKFESSQMSLEKSVELGRSMSDLTQISLLSPLPVREHNRTVSDVSSHQLSADIERERVKMLEKRIKELQEKEIPESEHIQQLERKILDLEENLREKESIIEARTKAVSLLTENLSKKRKDVVDNLEDTKQEMFKMQENFVEDVERLNELIAEKTDKVNNLEEANKILEKARFDLTLENAELNNRLEEVQDSSTKISELKMLNETLQKRISDLENQKYEFITDEEVRDAKQATFEESDEYKKLCAKIKELEESNSMLKDVNYSESVSSLEKLLEDKNLEIETLKKQIDEMNETVQEKTIENNVLNANFSVLQEKYNSMGPKSLFPESSADEELQAELTKLKQQLDDTNKSNIKTKLKMKQLQKQVDGFKKISNANQEVVKLSQEVQSLTQKVAELEEEKGNLQLHLVNYDGNVPETELAKRIKVLETTCQNQTSAIQLLEEQKIDITDDLNTTKHELESLKDTVKEQKDTETVKSEIHSIEIEEDLEKLKDEKSQLKNQLEDLQKSFEEMETKVQSLTEEKIELQVKLNSYINENMELLDKIEKLSMEKVSSAESIEMVENLTEQQKMEFEKSMHTGEPEEGNTEISEELNDSLLKLREESSELMQKIELFTTERREVLDKLEILTAENQNLAEEIEFLKKEKHQLENNNEKIARDLDETEKTVEELKKDKESLATDLKELNEHRSKLQEEINKLVKEQLASSAPSTPSKSASDMTSSTEGSPETQPETFVKENCEKLLKNLESEIQNYNKNKDKNKKLQISKKLAGEAKNTYNTMIKLVQEFFKNQEESEKLRDRLNSLVNLDQSSEEIKKLQAKVDSLSEKLKMKDEDLSMVKARLKILEHAEADLAAARFDLENLHAYTKKESKTKYEAIEKINQELEEKEQELFEKDQEIQKLKKEGLENFEKILKEKENEIKQLNEKLKERDDCIKENEAAEELQQKFDEYREKIEAELREAKHSLQFKEEEIERLKYKFEMKLQTSENEVEILKTLVADQKQMLIASYEEHELDMDKKCKENEDCQKKVEELEEEIRQLKESSENREGDELEALKKEKEKLEKLLKDTQDLLETNKSEYTNKQETIDSLNNQIIELYKTMEENSSKVLEKEDEIQYLQEIIDSNRQEIEKLNQKLSDNSRSIENLHAKLQNYEKVDVGALEKKVNELEAQKTKIETTYSALETENSKLKTTNSSLDTKNKEQLDKLKKFAANLKKKSQHCTELEEKLALLENSKESEVLSQKIKDFDALQREMDVMHDKVQNLEEIQSKFRDIQQKVVEYEDKMRLIEFENSRLNDHLQQSSGSENKVQKLQEEVKELTEKIDFVEEENWKLNDQLNQLKKMESENVQLHQKLDAISKDYQKVSSQFQEVQIKHEKETKELQMKYENEAKEKSEKPDPNDTKKKMDKLKAAVVTLKNKLAEKKNRVEELEAELQKLKSTEIVQSDLLQLKADTQQQIQENEKQLKEYYEQELKKCQEAEHQLKNSYEQGLKNALEEELTKLTQLLEVQHQENVNILRTTYEQEIEVHRQAKTAYEQEFINLKQKLMDLEKSNRQLNEDSHRRLSLEGQLETVEQENMKLKDKISKLEDAVSFVEARRNSWERQKKLMNQEFIDKAKQQAEHEDLLLQRLNVLTVQDELVEEKLKNSEEENFELTENLRETRREKELLVLKVTDLENELKKVQEFSDKIYQLESDNSTLSQQIKQLEGDMKKQQQEFEQKLVVKHSEIDDMEAELSTQLQRVENEKKTIQEALEKTQDQIVDFQDEVIRLKDQIHTLEQSKGDLERELSWIRLQNDNYTQDQLENQELRMQLMQEQTENENLRQQNESLLQNHTMEITVLKQQINDLETMRSRVSQNQTDDQVELQNENLRLKELLAEKQIQLQMALNNSSANDPFAAITSKTVTQTNVTPFVAQIQQTTAQFFQNQPSVSPVESNEVSRVSQLEREIENLRESQTILGLDLEATIQKNNDLMKANSRLQELELQNIELQQQILIRNNELEEIKKEVEVLRGFTSQIPEKVTDDGKIQALENELLEKQELIEKLHKTLQKYEQKPKPVMSTAMFFGGPSETDSSFPQIPVEEEIIVPKKTYKCYENATQTSVDQVDEWGWGGEGSQMQQKIQQLQAQQEHENIEKHQNYIKELQEQVNDLSVLEKNQSEELVRLRERLREAENSEDALRAKIQAEFQEKWKEAEVSQEQFLEKLREAENSQVVFKTAIQAEFQEKLKEVEAISKQKFQEKLDYLVGMEQDLSDRLKRAEESNIAWQEALKASAQDLEERKQTLNEQSAKIQAQEQQIQEYEEIVRSLEEANNRAVQEVIPAPVQMQGFERVPAHLFGTQNPWENPQPGTSQGPAPNFDSLAALDIEDGDGWGWGTENLLQHQQLQQKSLLSPRRGLEVKLQEEKDLSQQLTNENQQLREELANLREKSKKMMTKLKEYQNKIKDLENRNRKSASIESNELDLAIQEELKSQVEKLEAKLKELQADFDKEAKEKEALNKKIEVLSSANDRFVEMKERQDQQMELYQLKLKDLNEKLQKLEDWDEQNEEKLPVPVQMEGTPQRGNVQEFQRRIDDLTHQLKDQQVDFDELQALLDEEKSNTKILEERIKNLQEAGRQEDQKLEEKEQEVQELTVKLQQKDREVIELKSKVQDTEDLKSVIQNREQEIQEMRSKYSDQELQNLKYQIQQKHEENNELLNKLDLLSQESNNIKTILDELNVQNQIKTVENDTLNNKLKTMAQKNEELSKERNLFDKSLDGQLQEMEQQIQNLSAELQYKDAQIVHLNDKISSLVKEDQTESLVQEILIKNQEMTNLRDKVKGLEAEKVELENNLSIQLTQKLKDLGPADQENELKNRLLAFEKASREWQQEKQQMEHELQVLNDQVMSGLALEDKMKSTILDIDSKNMEIEMLKNSLEQLRNQSPNDNGNLEKMQTSFQATIDNLNAQWSQMVEQRGIEVAGKWREHVEMKEAEFAALEADLRHQIASAANVTVGEVAGEEEEPDLDRSRSEEFARMKEILEAQEIEIVSLKEQLAIRSAELGALSSRVDPYRQFTAHTVSLSPTPVPESDRVPRSELDLALYMLHQRDVKCEEMTLELMNLLQERDTLQLRLSNSIRNIEEIRKKYNIPKEQDSSDVSKTGTPEKAPATTTLPSLETVNESENELRTKLSELTAVKQSRDKTFREEREQRFNQISLIQQDIANLPREAVTRIVGQQPSADPIQSPSSTLLNWILGKKSSDSS